MIVTIDKALNIGLNKQLIINVPLDTEIKEDKKYDLTEHKEKRSKNANAYLWELLGKLQDKLIIPKEDLYKNYIREIGAFDTLAIKNEAVETFVREWNARGLGYQVELITSNDVVTELAIYYGSSAYNTKQMSNLIELVIEDCKEQGIETKSADEIRSMIGEARWTNVERIGGNIVWNKK